MCTCAPRSHPGLPGDFFAFVFSRHGISHVLFFSRSQGSGFTFLFHRPRFETTYLWHDACCPRFIFALYFKKRAEKKRLPRGAKRCVAFFGDYVEAEFWEFALPTTDDRFRVLQTRLFQEEVVYCIKQRRPLWRQATKGEGLLEVEICRLHGMH